MIKLLDIIEEGALTLTPDERQQVEDMLPDIISNIKKPFLPNDKAYDIGNIKYKFADGEDGEAKVVVGFIEGNAKGQFRTHDPKNRTDNWIIINQVYFSQFFPSSNSFSDFDQRLTIAATGNENTGIERLRQTLKHEVIHAKDPALNHHYLKEPYSSEDEAIYYGSWAEFQTFTGQFFESLVSGTDRVLNKTDNPEDIKKIEKALSNILQYFAGKTKTINLDTKEFIDGTGSRNFFQKIFNFLNQTVRMPKDSDYALSEYLTYLAKIKQYNPEGYKEFLKDLYKTIKSIEEKVNSVSNTKIKVQEMKTQINEVKRMQQLAGLLTEAEEEQAGDTSSELASIFKTQDVSSFVNQFKAIASDPKVQAILKAGITDGNPEDEKVTYAKGNIAVKGLLPTQNEIGFDQSIANILTDQYGSLKSILGGSANVGGPIVTYNGKYVIDGHHRWSQVYAANPNATMENLDIKGDLPPTEILKLVHAAIAAKIGKVPSTDPKGINILNGISEKQVLDAVNSKLADNAKTIWAKNGQKDNNAIAKHIYDNLKQLINKNKPIAGAPGRKDMPQTDQGGAATDKLSLLQKGMINFKDPKSSDIKNDQPVKEIKQYSKIKSKNPYHLTSIYEQLTKEVNTVAIPQTVMLLENNLINNIQGNDYFTIEERQAVSLYLKYYNTFNEENVNEFSGGLLNEGLRDWIGSAWDKIKNVFGNIKDFVAKVWKSIKDFVMEQSKKAYNFAKSKFNQHVPELKKKLVAIKDKAQLSIEAAHINKIYEWLKPYIPTMFNNLGKKAEEKAITEIKEVVMNSTFTRILVEETESIPTDITKPETVAWWKKIGIAIKPLLETLALIFNPIKFALVKIFQELTPQILNELSKFIAKLGGPAPINYIILPGILVEVLELKGVFNGVDDLIKVSLNLIPGIGPALETIMDVGHIIFMLLALYEIGHEVIHGFTTDTTGKAIA
jgi:hypothetical protein